MNSEVEISIRQGTAWSKLPTNIKQVLGNSQKEYDKSIIQFSIKNQLRYRGNLVRSVKKDEKGYYDELLKYSRDHLMLYPYHLSDFIVTGMRITPFQYYTSIMQDLLEQERSYDSLPNFTAADCLRLLGIGRNQYIDLMNQSRSSKKFFGVRKRPVRDLLPMKPISSVSIESWWRVQVGYVTEDDIRVVSPSEKIVIDKIIDHGPQLAGNLDLKDVKALYIKGLIYLDVPVEESDCFIVPPLEGFVMNRVLGDYFENLLYQIFVSIDEHTNITELANVLQTDLQLVKNVVSMYCRLGFARKKGAEIDDTFHSSWKNVNTHKEIERTRSKEVEDFMNLLNTDSGGDIVEEAATPTSHNCSPDEIVPDLLSNTSTHSKRIGFLFDSTLTAFLMMGNLSPGLKSHAVTMFEVGKLSDESLDSFLIELEKVGDVGEGEAQRYFHHALTLRNTILFLRNNPEMSAENKASGEGSSVSGPGLDLIRCESLQSLRSETCSRLLNKNYSLLVSMAPLTNEIRPITSCKPPHLGPAIPEVNSVWFKLFIYTLTKFGPPSLLLVKGSRLLVLPKVFRSHKRLLVTTWGHDPGNVPVSNALTTLNDALCHSAVLIQGQGTGGDVTYVPFPLDENESSNSALLRNHEAIRTLSKHFDLTSSCGYISMMHSTVYQTPTWHDSCSSHPAPAAPPLPATTPKEGATPPISSSSSTSSPSSLGGAGGGGGMPVNGIKDNASKLLLASELDKLDEVGWEAVEEKTKKSKKPSDLDLLSDGGHRNPGEVFRAHEWTLLDCCFGIPLFDSTLNTQVCKKVVKFKLCQEQNLVELTNSNSTVSKQLLDFISQNQENTLDLSGKNFVFPTKQNGVEQEQPLPNKNLLFFRGELTVWDGS